MRSPSPSSSVSFRSFFARFTGSQASTFAARSSTFAKSSIAICASSSIFGFSAFFCSIGFGMRALSASISLSTSMRGKSVSPFSTTASAGVTPHVPAVS